MLRGFFCLTFGPKEGLLQVYESIERLRYVSNWHARLCWAGLGRHGEHCRASRPPGRADNKQQTTTGNNIKMHQSPHMTFKAATEQNPRQTLANVPTYLFSFTAFKVSTSTLKIHTLNLNQ